jgi:hypothetical protein
MSEEDKYSEIVKRIMRATIRGDAEWETFEIPEPEQKENKRYVQPGYEVEYNGKVLKIYRVRQKERVLNVSPYQISATGPTDDDFREEWISNTVLEIRDPETGGRWQFPNRSALDDLYDAVQRKTAGVDKWIDGMLDKE